MLSGASPALWSIFDGVIKFFGASKKLLCVTDSIELFIGWDFPTEILFHSHDEKTQVRH